MSAYCLGHTTKNSCLQSLHVNLYKVRFWQTVGYDLVVHSVYCYLENLGAFLLPELLLSWILFIPLSVIVSPFGLVAGVGARRVLTYGVSHGMIGT